MATERPLSPHLDVYRFQLPMVLSITHRMSGVFLGIGSLLLVYWLLAVAAGPEAYARAESVFGSVIGQLALVAWTFALYFHLCNGIRHLCWDVGRGYAIQDAYRSGYLVIAGTLVLTAVTWIGIWTGGAA
jgi:succinate dehydrogenase / fumarate reductase cytochrome b subunit